MGSQRLIPQRHIEYIRALFAKEDAPLHHIGAHLSPDQKKMQIGAEEGKLLQVLLTMIGAKRGVEIGSLHGYSAVWMARALPQDGQLWVMEKNATRIEPIRQNIAACGQEERITIVEGAADEQLPTIESQGPFDFVFIDADKEGYVRYLDWAEKHVRKGGLIIGDNSFLFGHVIESTPPVQFSEAAWRSMRQFNERLADPEKYTSILIPTEEGLTVAIKNT